MRRPTVVVTVGGVEIGGEHPIVVQSMTNTDTSDVDGTVAQAKALAEAGSELVRVTVNNEAAALAVPEIVARLSDEGTDVPIVGDFHYNGHLLLTESSLPLRVPDSSPTTSTITGELISKSSL